MWYISCQDFMINIKFPVNYVGSNVCIWKMHFDPLRYTQMLAELDVYLGLLTYAAQSICRFI